MMTFGDNKDTILWTPKYDTQFVNTESKCFFFFLFLFPFLSFYFFLLQEINVIPRIDSNMLSVMVRIVFMLFDYQSQE